MSPPRSLRTRFLRLPPSCHSSRSSSRACRKQQEFGSALFSAAGRAPSEEASFPCRPASSCKARASPEPSSCNASRPACFGRPRPSRTRAGIPLSRCPAATDPGSLARCQINANLQEAELLVMRAPKRARGSEGLSRAKFQEALPFGQPGHLGPPRLLKDARDTQTKGNEKQSQSPQSQGRAMESAFFRRAEATRFLVGTERRVGGRRKGGARRLHGEGAKAGELKQPLQSTQPAEVEVRAVGNVQHRTPASSPELCTCEHCRTDLYEFCPTRLNPADCPTRDRVLPEPSSSTITSSLDFDGLYELATLPKLRRWAANWARLVCLLLPPPPALRPDLGWRSLRHSSRLFDSSLGFHGEGPGFGEFRVLLCFLLAALPRLSHGTLHPPAMPLTERGKLPGQAWFCRRPPRGAAYTGQARQAARGF